MAKLFTGLSLIVYKLFADRHAQCPVWLKTGLPDLVGTITDRDGPTSCEHLLLFSGLLIITPSFVAPKRLETPPGIPKNIHWCDSDCSWLFGSHCRR